MSPSSTKDSHASPTATDQRVLLGTTPLTDALVVPTFHLSPAVGTGFLGEPTMVSDAKGRLVLTFPGCEKSHTSCRNAPIFRSGDGMKWESLNRLGNGSLDPRKGVDSPAANGDAMISIDAAGNLYASNLGTGLPHWRSVDDGASWQFMGNPVPKGDGSDRQWGWGGPAGMVVSAWMATSPARAAAVSVSHDGGGNWSKPQELDATIGWIGPVSGTPDGQKLFVGYTKPLNADGANAVPDPTGLVGATTGNAVVADPQTELRLLRSLDGGTTWSIVKTGHVIVKDPAAAQWSGTLMAPVLARTGDGTLVYAWSEQRLDAPARAASIAASVYEMTSKDDGATWSAPQLLSGARTAIMPWVVAGSGARHSVAYYASSDVHVDHDYEGTWDVESVTVQGKETVTAIVAPKVHTGGICAKGGVCGTTLADRSMLDFMGGAVLPDGRVAWAYASSAGGPVPNSIEGVRLGGAGTSVLVAVQDAGSRLLPSVPLPS